MIVMMSEKRMKGLAKRLRKVLRGLGVEFKHYACVELAARLCGFQDWRHFLSRDLEAPLSLLDEDLSEEDFAARDAFQMRVLESAGLGAAARELLDRANPTGSWSRQAMEEPVFDAVGGNDPL
ncbi:hypothetical protein I6F30_11220 [Bradyrhizobium sp. NBAIM20]|uniref:glyoxalase superfamily protein n=1 Tax=unclassified Bradyrhizobium TaxID=2631580 RepID=UPI001CD76A5B|nr:MULTISPECIES: glyoxalase superfamily protein [unclassified Bradyrhizobium]MCA1411706.1 hypothetical protein [Bradyrhizobium sp. NBAIM20]MCA1460959.1 hypothetical protein [Bradyrhizobium sp. NBAIM18]